jgi:hypothetical protein
LGRKAIGIEIEERVDVTTIAREIDHRATANRIADGLIRTVDQRRFGRNVDGLARRRNFELRVCPYRVTAVEFDPCDLGRSHAGQGNRHLVFAASQSEDPVLALRTGFRFPRIVGGEVENHHLRVSDDRSRRICHQTRDGAQICTLREHKLGASESGQQDQENSEISRRLHTRRTHQGFPGFTITDRQSPGFNHGRP